MRKPYIIIVFVPALILAAGFFHNVSFFEKGLLFFENTPLLLRRALFGGGGQEISSLEITALGEDVRRLEEENAALRSEISGRKELGSEAAFELPATILYTGSLPGRRQFWVDRGDRDGIVSGMAVVVAGNILLGVIEEVVGRRSLVNSTVDPFFRATVEITSLDGATSTHALVAGSGERLRFSFSEVDGEIERNDRVYTDGKDGKLKAGLLLGYVDETGHSEDQLFQEGWLVPVYGSELLSTAFILL